MTMSVELCFRVPSSRPGQPVVRPERVLVEDSSNRLSRVLDAPDQEMDQEVGVSGESSGGVVNEYFKKPGQDVCASPAIDIEMPPPESSECEEKENTNSSGGSSSSSYVKTMIKLAKKCSSGLDWPARVGQLIDFLGIQSDVELGRVKSGGGGGQIKEVDDVPGNKSMLSVRPNTGSGETGYSVQTLQMSHCLCKFCESLIESVDGASGGSGEIEQDEGCNKENKIRFCSTYCKNSYKKVRITCIPTL